jgi:hypothetical protein
MLMNDQRNMISNFKAQIFVWQRRLEVLNFIRMFDAFIRIKNSTSQLS